MNDGPGPVADVGDWNGNDPVVEGLGGSFSGAFARPNENEDPPEGCADVCPNPPNALGSSGLLIAEPNIVGLGVDPNAKGLDAETAELPPVGCPKSDEVELKDENPPNVGLGSASLFVVLACRSRVGLSSIRNS